MTIKTLAAAVLAATMTATTAASAFTPAPPTFDGSGSDFDTSSMIIIDPPLVGQIDGDWESSGVLPSDPTIHLLPCWDGIKDVCSEPPRPPRRPW